MFLPRSAALAMRGSAVFAFVWAVARAHVQAVTGDEGENYVVFVAPHFDKIWSFSPTNHLLYALLSRVVTGVFGPAPLALRAPALFGAAMYISVAFWLCHLLTREWKVRLPLFVCLVYNPFVFDYLVAARGYGLASAFLLLAITLHVWAHGLTGDHRDSVICRVAALSSVCLVLSLSANFSFSFVVVTAGIALSIWNVAKTGVPKLRLAVWTLAPALLAFAVLPAWTVFHAERSGLYYGADSLSQTIRSITLPCLFELNVEVANPWVYGLLSAIHPYLPRAMLAAVVAVLLYQVARGIRGRGSGGSFVLLAVCAGAVAGSLAIHLAAHRLIRLPLPLERTGLYIVVLATVCIGVLAAMPAMSRPGRVARGALIAVLCTFAVYDLFCLRLTYFREWSYQQEVRDLYHVASWYARSQGMKDIEVTWYYFGAFSYYRLATGQADLIPPFASGVPHKTGRQLYVLNAALDRDFIAKQKLDVVWRSPITEAAIALPARSLQR